MLITVCKCTAQHTRDSLLSKDQVRFEADNIFTDLLDVLFLHLQDSGKVFLTSNFYIRLERLKWFVKVWQSCGWQKMWLYLIALFWLTWLSPFLYSREQSRSTIRGFLMRRRMRGCVTSLFTITPFSTHESSMLPPGTYKQPNKPLNNHIFCTLCWLTVLE